ncbi:hypothetical protein MKW98_021486 [Papaver atlanticum]|uniref:Programmed cell death protein 4-like n=1 Tax=Papaver atlanticum TaxID=357466 RepID=A0AAD4XJ95_9MAGN|nr:hypothetical protein MKW98_021486 [Papaver atlanticum]
MRQGSEKNGKNGKSGFGVEAKKDRKSGSGVDGEPKKNGYGGKFTWSGNGGIADDYTEELVLDEKDPNFVHPQDN